MPYEITVQTKRGEIFGHNVSRNESFDFEQAMARSDPKWTTFVRVPGSPHHVRPSEVVYFSIREVKA